MDQLSLFPGVAARLKTTAVELPSADEPIAEPEPAPGVGSSSQIGLFDARVRELRAIREAIALGEIDQVRHRLQSVEPGADFDVGGTRERLSKISEQLVDAGRLSARGSVVAIATLARKLAADGEPWSRLGRTLLVRAAVAVEDEPSSLAGRLRIEAGDLDGALSVLTSALEPTRTADLLFALGDVQTLRGNPTSARRHYRDALLIDPFDAAFENVLDDDVRSLADIAESDVEIEGEPRAWAAAVGIVAGVLALPSPSDFPLSEPNPSLAAALGRTRRFIEALVLTTAPHGRQGPTALIEARRTMKRASPALFAWYMARLTGPLRSPSFAQQPRAARNG
jgi:tetratricopeptide (TPR) repeat protein